MYNFRKIVGKFWKYEEDSETFYENKVNLEEIPGKINCTSY